MVSMRHAVVQLASLPGSASRGCGRRAVAAMGSEFAVGGARTVAAVVTIVALFIAGLYLPHRRNRDLAGNWSAFAIRARVDAVIALLRWALRTASPQCGPGRQWSNSCHNRALLAATVVACFAPCHHPSPHLACSRWGQVEVPKRELERRPLRLRSA